MKIKLTVCFRLNQHDTFRLKIHQAAYPILVLIETKIKKQLTVVFMKKLLDSDWLRAVQSSETPVKKV